MKTKKIAIFFELIIFSLLLQVILAGNTTFKWVDYRYILILLSVIIFLPFSKEKLSYKTVSFFLPIALFTMTTPLIMQQVKEVSILSSMLWVELGFFLYYYSLIILGQMIIEQFNFHKLAVLSGAIAKTIVALYPLAFISYYLVYKDLLDANSIVALYQTNLKESYEFVVASATSWQMIVLGLIFVLLLVFNYVTSKKFGLEKHNLEKKYLVIILIILLALYPRLNSNYLMTIVTESQDYLKAVKNFQAYRLNNQVQAKTNLSGNKTFVVIIGESQTREQLNAYGYSRPNTPFMTSLLNKPNYIFYKNAFSNHTLTMKVLSKALTEANQYNQQDFEKVYSIIDVAKAAGFKTIWLSNQAKLGNYNTPITVISDLCAEQYWTNENANWGNKYDEEILEYLPKIPKNGLNLVFIHLNGNHYEYKDRYPEQYNVFKDKTAISEQVEDQQQFNEYDNSVLYSDHVLQELFKYSQEELQASAIVYFSDHGEDLKTGNKHIPSKFSLSMAKIPLLLYFSDAYKQDNSALYNNFSGNRDKYFTNDLIYETLVSLLNIETPHTSQENSLGSNLYKYEKQDLKILDKSIDLSKE